jgi:hypothetical protein
MGTSSEVEFSPRSDMFEFCDFKNHMQFENLGAAVKHMDRMLAGWREKSNEHVGWLVCLALGMDACDLADIDRRKRLGIS